MPKVNTFNYDTIASWNGSQDLFVVEQPDGTKVATPNMVKQFVLNSMDEVPTQDSPNPVKSGGIFSTMAVPRVDTANRRMYLEGGAAFNGNIDSSPTAGSNNAVASGGTKSYVDTAIAGIDDKIAFKTFTPEDYPSWDNFPYNARGYGYTAQTNNPGFNGFVLCWGAANVRIQLAFAYNQTAQKYRAFVSGAWGAWTSF